MGQDTPIRTGIPLLVEGAGDIVNTVDFHVSSTNWINIVSEPTREDKLPNYINNVAAVYAWNYTKHTSDPITHQARFFDSMNQGTLPLKWESIDEKVINLSSGYEVRYLSKLDTLLEPTWIWIRNDEGHPETRVNSETGKTEYHAQDLANIGAQDSTNTGDHWLKYDYDTQEITLDRISLLDDVWGMSNIEVDQEFLMYWAKKYRRSHYMVKQSYVDTLAALNIAETENYFTSISDSIGLLSRSTYYPDTSVIPKMDIDFGLVEELSDSEHVATAPYMHSCIIDDKIDDETKDMLTEFSLRTNMLFRTNQASLFRAIGHSSNSHGEDMINDFSHFSRMYMLRGELEGHVNEMLGNAHIMLGYMQIADNTQEIDNPSFDLVVEDSVVKVDVLKNKYHTLTSILTSRSQNDDVLKYKITTTDPS